MKVMNWPPYPYNKDKLFSDFVNGCNVFGVSPDGLDNEDNSELLRHCAWCFADIVQMPREKWDFESYIRTMFESNKRDFIESGKDLVWVINRVFDLILQICDNLELRMAYIRYMHDSGFDQYNRIEI